MQRTYRKYKAYVYSFCRPPIPVSIISNIGTNDNYRVMKQLVTHYILLEMLL